MEVGPLQLSDLTALQSGQEGFVIIRQLTAVDWLYNFLTDKPNLHRGLLFYWTQAITAKEINNFIFKNILKWRQN